MGEKVGACDDEPSVRYPAWTRGNVGEVSVEAVSPLPWSKHGRRAWEPGWRDAFYEMGVFTPEDFRPAGECEICACFGGYVYINMSVTRVMAVRVPGLTVEAMDKSLFGDYADAPPYRPDPRDENAERSAAVGSLAAIAIYHRPEAGHRSGPRPLECDSRAATGPVGADRRGVADLLPFPFCRGPAPVQAACAQTLRGQRSGEHHRADFPGSRRGTAYQAWCHRDGRRQYRRGHRALSGQPGDCN